MPLDIIKFLVATLRNQDNKVALIQVDECGALPRSSELIKICHNMNIIVQNTCEDAHLKSMIKSKSQIINLIIS